ncbi:ATP-binding cassette domain-containing protein [Rhodoferax ferrireducens]|uniref:ATP-binding cassette domain-containing protein n=1 Tax=Rhodoferax ferrireducens TaxID=192843 RepID=UPI003B3AF8B8
MNEAASRLPNTEQTLRKFTAPPIDTLETNGHGRAHESGPSGPKPCKTAAAILTIHLTAVGKGRIVALLGSNGAGKSTTLQGISGVLYPKDAEIKGGQIARGDIFLCRAQACRVASGIHEAMKRLPFLTLSTSRLPTRMRASFVSEGTT